MQYTTLIINKFCYRLCRLREGEWCAAAQIRRNEILPSMGVLRGDMPVSAFTSPMHSKKHVSLIFFVIYFQELSNIMKLIHFAIIYS
jgi:hypothetical protein